MAELGDTRAIQKLFTEEMQDCSDTVREAAVEILGKVAGKDDVGVRLWDTKVWSPSPTTARPAVECLSLLERSTSCRAGSAGCVRSHARLVPLFAWDHSGVEEILSRWLATGVASLQLANARAAWSHLMQAVLAVLAAKVEVPARYH